MFKKLFLGILGLLGIIKKTKPYRTDGNADFLNAIKQPGTIILVGGPGQALPEGIEAVTDSFWAHCFGISDPGWCIEAEGGGIQHNQIDKYLTDTCQMVAYQFDLTPPQLIQLLTWVRAQVGKLYGFLEFLEELAPNPSAISARDTGYICSALWACGYKQIGLNIINSKIDPRVATPADINDACEPNLNAKMFKYNW